MDTENYHIKLTNIATCPIQVVVEKDTNNLNVEEKNIDLVDVCQLLIPAYADNWYIRDRSVWVSDSNIAKVSSNGLVSRKKIALIGSKVTVYVSGYIVDGVNKAYKVSGKVNFILV